MTNESQILLHDNKQPITSGNPLIAIIEDPDPVLITTPFVKISVPYDGREEYKINHVAKKHQKLISF
jgi:hypothetical protein